MTIYPAIDLYGGKVVRLRRGEFSTAKEMAPDLLEVALRFKEAGCNWIHVVDLEELNEDIRCI
jgi:phosphoribosylformimino-5-aminoimidazole carboxamide ribotide isomerase